jgi:hypothetical protein
MGVSTYNVGAGYRNATRPRRRIQHDRSSQREISRSHGGELIALAYFLLEYCALSLAEFLSSSVNGWRLKV